MRNPKFKKGDQVFYTIRDEILVVSRVYRIKGEKSDFFKYKVQDYSDLISEHYLDLIIDETKEDK